MWRKCISVTNIGSSASALICYWRMWDRMFYSAALVFLYCLNLFRENENTHFYKLKQFPKCVWGWGEARENILLYYFSFSKVDDSYKLFPWKDLPYMWNLLQILKISMIKRVYFQTPKQMISSGIPSSFLRHRFKKQGDNPWRPIRDFKCPIFMHFHSDT